jgi:hypothetical protein
MNQSELKHKLNSNTKRYCYEEIGIIDLRKIEQTKGKLGLNAADLKEMLKICTESIGKKTLSYFSRGIMCAVYC